MVNVLNILDSEIRLLVGKNEENPMLSIIKFDKSDCFCWAVA